SVHPVPRPRSWRWTICDPARRPHAAVTTQSPWRATLLHASSLMVDRVQYSHSTRLRAARGALLRLSPRLPRPDRLHGGSTKDSMEERVLLDKDGLRPESWRTAMQAT